MVDDIFAEGYIARLPLLRAVSAEEREESPDGGIGRRAGFRYLWPQGRGSSSLLLGTKPVPGHHLGALSVVSTQFMPGGTIHLHKHDLPDGLALGSVVAVDTETGIIKVERVVAVHDCGRPINPLDPVDAQIELGEVTISNGLPSNVTYTTNAGKQIK